MAERVCVEQLKNGGDAFSVKDTFPRIKPLTGCATLSLVMCGIPMFFVLRKLLGKINQ